MPATAARAGATTGALEAEAVTALGAVLDPELDEPITDLGFVRSLSASPDGDLTVHLRLPTSFCSPNFAYLMASDAKDALAALPGVRSVRVELDDHHDSDLINRGLAADAGYRGTFGAEAEESLEELRATFRRKAHTAAAERALTALLRADPQRREADLSAVTLADLPDTPATGALLRRARSVRISIDGNAHFCRGLLRTRYPGSAADQAPCAHGDTDPGEPGEPAAPARSRVDPASRPLLPLEVTAP